jgi:hypothetical protein
VQFDRTLRAADPIGTSHANRTAQPRRLQVNRERHSSVHGIADNADIVTLNQQCEHGRFIPTNGSQSHKYRISRGRHAEPKKCIFSGIVFHEQPRRFRRSLKIATKRIVRDELCVDNEHQPAGTGPRCLALVRQICLRLINKHEFSGKTALLDCGTAVEAESISPND